MPTRIKVCGITRLEDALLAVELGASALGFNFYRPSPRYIDPRAARSMIDRLPPLVVSVGVYANETDMEAVTAVAREAGVSAIQLHGPRFPELTGQPAGYPLIRAVAVGEDFKAEMLADFHVNAFLLDAFHPNLSGGTGRPFDWELAREANRYGTIILAGGLNPENVRRAIREVRPFAVDVASGVESAPGQKDPALLRAFFAAVAEADRDL
ncbi:MAG TPA: phosphoribosylanthranilate isomerase [Terriglobia bacterium]|nr:phosphoribosylanthranilate isomerase [Terriglobia bacterium]HVB28679.1 phosphoribosylanthranilate isomerase [Terriglobia bacterium]